MSAPVRPASGLFSDPREVTELADLFANVWQICWVTTDLERGMEVLRERFGVEHCVEVPTDGATFLKGEEPVDWHARVAMGARGGPILELIEPVGGEVDFYRRFLPEDGSADLRLHHLATFIPLGDDAWASLGGAPRKARAERGLHRADPGPGPGRLRGHNGPLGPLAGGLPAAGGGHRVLQRAGGRQRLSAGFRFGASLPIRKA